jgi:hypothetical protein
VHHAIRQSVDGFDTQRNHGLSTQTQGLKTQHPNEEYNAHAAAKAYIRGFQWNAVDCTTERGTLKLDVQKPSVVNM